MENGEEGIIKNNNEDLTNSLENRIGEYFSDLNLNSNQINKINELLSKELQQNEEGTGNLKIREKRILKKYKKILNENTNIEEGIKKIENELTELSKGNLDTNNQDLSESSNNQDLSEDSNNQSQININKYERIEIKNSDREKSDKKVQEKINEHTNEAIEIAKNIKEVAESFTKLNEKYKTTDPQELVEKKSTLPEETKKKLEENNINVDDYVQYTLSREKITELGGNDNSKETRDFLKNLKTLEDNLGIRTETAKGLPLTADKATFESNPELNNFKNNNEEISQLERSSYLGKEDLDITNPEKLKVTLKSYKKMEEIYKDNKNFPQDEKFQEISKKIIEEKFSELKQEDINYYADKLDNLNGWITDYIKGSAAQAPLTGVLRYLDSYCGFDKNTLADRFAKGKDEYITMNDTTMHIEGVIDGNPLSFYYDIKEGATKISCDDILHVENDKYEIYNGIGGYPKSDLKINMPSIKDITNNLKNINDDTYKKLLNESSNLEDFQGKITNLINENVKNTFPENDEIKTRMARFTEKNLTAQAFDSALIGDSSIKEALNSKAKEPGDNSIKRMLLLVDNTTEKNTSTNLIELKQGFKNLEGLLGKTREELNRIKDPVARESLLSIKNAKESRDYNQREKATTDFISLFEQKDDINNPEFKMNIDDFTAFIELANKDEYTTETILTNNFSPEFKNKYNNTEIIKKGKANQEETIQKREKEQKEKELFAIIREARDLGIDLA